MPSYLLLDQRYFEIKATKFARYFIFEKWESIHAVYYRILTVKKLKETLYPKI